MTKNGLSNIIETRPKIKAKKRNLSLFFSNMTKREIIWRYLSHQAISQKQITFVQKALANQFGFSLSTVNNALKAPRATGAIKVTGRDFSIVDKEKFLYLWATYRKINKEIVYSTCVSKAVQEIEGQMPPGAIFGAYSAYRHKFHEAPADYDKVYVYAASSILAEIKKRFPPADGYPNLFVLKSDAWLEKINVEGIAPVEQMFVDIWNLTDWYAKDFLQTLKERIFE